MKPKLVYFFVLLFSLSVVQTSCKKDEDKSLTEEYTSKLTEPSYWQLSTVIFKSEDYNFNLLDYVYPCGQNDQLIFSENGFCQVIKEECDPIFGEWKVDKKKLTYSKDGEDYVYTINSLDETLLVVETEVYLEGMTGSMIETYFSN